MADGLHGDLSQKQRDTVMSKFREGSLEVLVATDVAARGLDVSGVTHVYNFDIPQDIDSYVHRIGRTGRAGKSGIASTFVTPREIDHLHQIERITRHRITKRPLPTFSEAKQSKQRMAMEQLLTESQSEDLGVYRAFAEELLNQQDSIALVSAALKMLTGSTTEVPIQLTAEAPIRIRRPQNQGRGDRNRRSGGGDYRRSSGSGDYRRPKQGYVRSNRHG